MRELKFKVGDKVKFEGAYKGGVIESVIDENDEYPYWVRFADDDTRFCSEINMKLVEPQPKPCTNTTKKLILLNGPANCGKSVAVKYLKQELNGYSWQDSRCKDRLFQLTMQLFNVSDSVFWEIYNNRETKEKPNPHFPISLDQAKELSDLLGSSDLWQGLQEDKVFLSVRNAMIYVSELVAKKMFGQDYFGVCRKNDIVESTSTVFIDDSMFGTMDEVVPSIDELGLENVYIIKIIGRGDFSNDSRSYVDEKLLPRGLKLDVVKNTKTEQEFKKEILELVFNFLEEDNEKI